MSSFWSAWVIILTVVTFIGTFWVLFANRTRAPADPEQTTGHAADGIEEYDNPLPYWWFLMFMITMVFGIAYLIAYPGLGNFPGLLGWSQVQQWENEVARAEERFSAVRYRYLAMPVEEVLEHPEALRMGQRLYGVNCSVCHGADAKGAYGFPNLADGDWLWGGTPDAIKHTLIHGRQAAMPAWEAALGDTGIRNVAAYVVKLSGRDVNEEMAAAGKAQYDILCVACHGPEGKGNPVLGAPNLTNGIWLYGGSESEIQHTLRVGRNGVMPAFGDQLSEDKIHLITAYIYSLSQE
ncbi:MAG: cytochrome-c oxidase, cbb3-type subunit III [Halieaceae bacterium]|jgi:cytochrome c oxidase cbb3-type subunit 3|nr:cytochrome-c oxidase, cbb3-type subunit III [Halieaceae bacterium]